MFQMRIYDGDFTVRNIVDDCSVKPEDPLQQHRRVVDGLDLDKLAERVSHIPVAEIRQRRERMNVFYEEILHSADPDRGISFTSCLMILAQYNVITDTRSLRLEEFLRRRARLQRVQESIRRNTVIGFFDTLYWSRRFRRAIDQHRNSRLGAPPQLSVPEIFIENPDDVAESSSRAEPHDFTQSPALPSPKMAPPRLPPLDTSWSARDSGKMSPASPGFDLSPGTSPIRSSVRLHSMDTSYSGARRSSPTTPTLGHSRQGSNASAIGAQGVMESFDASAWGESLRRSFTMRRQRRMSQDH